MCLLASDLLVQSPCPGCTPRQRAVTRVNGMNKYAIMDAHISHRQTYYAIVHLRCDPVGEQDAQDVTCPS